MRLAKIWAGVAVVGLVSSAVGAASAAGISVARFGAEHGTPMTSNATSLYYNPAGLGFADGGHLYGDLSLAWRSAKFSHQHSSLDWTGDAAAMGSNEGEGTLFNVIASPMFGVSYQLGELRLGAAFFTPFGGAARWNTNDAHEGNKTYPGAQDGVQRWYTIDGELRSSFVSLGAAYQLTPELSLGLVGNLIISKVETVRARNADGSNNVVTEGRSLVDVSGRDFSLGAGVLVRPYGDDSLRVGLSYQSRPNLGGHQRLSGTLSNNFGGIVSVTDVDLEQDLPDVIRWGVSFRNRPQTWEVRLFGDYTRWGVLGYQCVLKKGKDCTFDLGANTSSPDIVQNQYRDWHDTASVRFGASYFASPSVEYFAGGGYASSAIPATTLEPALMDFPSISVSAGARWRLLQSLYVMPSYTQVFYLSRDTTGLSEHATYGAQTGTVSPDSGGKYSQDIGVLSVSAEFVF